MAQRGAPKMSKADQKAQDKFENDKMRILEKAERSLQRKKEQARELDLHEKAERAIRDVIASAEPADRDLQGLSQALLYVADCGSKVTLTENTCVRTIVVFKDHFTNTAVLANNMYCTGAIASSIKQYDHIWSALVKCVIAGLRFHQQDDMILSNGLFALGELANSAKGLKDLIAATQGAETIIGSMRLHPADHILQSNGCLALSRCNQVPVKDLGDDPDYGMSVLVANEQIQSDALDLDALQVIVHAELEHCTDPVFARAFAEAAAGLNHGNDMVDDDDFLYLVNTMTKNMDTDYYEVAEEELEQTKTFQFMPVEEVHGKDELVVAYTARALGMMCLNRSTHKSAGTEERFPFLVSEPRKQALIAKTRAIPVLCGLLSKFPKKKDTVLSFAYLGLQHLMRQNEENQKLVVKHKAVEFIMNSIQRWQEDTEYFFRGLNTIKVLLEGTDGVRNQWFLDSYKGRDVAKIAVKHFQAQANRSGNLERMKQAQEMARMWLPERKAQMEASDQEGEASQGVRFQENPSQTPSGSPTPGQKSTALLAAGNEPKKEAEGKSIARKKKLLRELQPSSQ